MARVLGPVRNAGRIWTEPAAAATAGGYTPDEQNNIEIYRAARDATVNITSTWCQRGLVLRECIPQEGAGSGFIINPDGEILTNNHVVSGSAQLTVTLADKKNTRRNVLARDRRNDLALIKIEAGRKLPALRLGDSDGLVVGQKVLAIGNPFGLRRHADHRDRQLARPHHPHRGRPLCRSEGESLEGMIQTDAAINPGNSGGPLLDSHGNVIGINTAILGSQGNIGIGFAMPINRAKAMLEEYSRTATFRGRFWG